MYNGVRLYDVQGRVALRQRSYASGSGRYSIRIDFEASSTFTAGIYFARVIDAGGRVSSAVKVVA